MEIVRKTPPITHAGRPADKLRSPAARPGEDRHLDEGEPREYLASNPPPRAAIAPLPTDVATYRCLADPARHISQPGCPMRRLIVFSAAVLLMVGCGEKAKKGSVAGTLKYKGQPVNGATLLLYPVASTGGDAISIPVSQLGTFRSSGVPEGQYKVVVQGRASSGVPAQQQMRPEKAAEAQQKLQQLDAESKPTIPFPDKYKDITQTDLKCTVGKGEVNLDLELTD
jgi:hypothetical protein